MPQLDNFSAWISVDDQPLQEYGVEYAEDQLCATCWVASEAGKSFTISWRDAVRTQASMGRTFIDGIKCGVPKGINKKGYKIDSSKENDTAHQRGAATSMDKDRQLVFSSVNWTDEDRFLDLAPSNKLGEIRLEISYVQKGSTTTGLEIHEFRVEGKVHELRKQMTPHHTKLGPLFKGERKPVHMVRSMGKTRVFIFNYRPLETLKALGTVPQDYKPPACKAIDLTMEDSSLGSASTNIDQEFENDMNPVPEPIKNASTSEEEKFIKGDQAFKMEDKKFKIEEIADTKYSIKKENLPEDEKTILKAEDNPTKIEHIEPKVKVEDISEDQ